MQVYAETQSGFIRIVTASMTRLPEAQSRAGKMIAESNDRLKAKIAETNVSLDEKVAETNARLDRPAAMLERDFKGGNGAS